MFDGGPAVECEAQDTVIAATARLIDRDAAGALDETARLLAYGGSGASFCATLMPGAHALQAFEAISSAGEVWVSDMSIKTKGAVQ